MLRHHLLLFLRNIKRQKSSFLINVIGLSTGLACVMLIALWVSDELKVDKFYPEHQQIYQVIEHIQFTDGLQTLFETFSPMAEVLTEQIPEVKYAAATIQPGWFGKHVLSVGGENNLKAVGQLASEDYFMIFQHKLIQGNREELLQSPDAIVISKSLALSLFGTIDNVVGQQVEYEQKRPFQVSGIFEDVPLNATDRFDFVLSTEAYKDVPPWTSLNNWNSSGPQVYALLDEGADIAQVNAKIDKIRKEGNENSIRTPMLIPFSEHYLYGTYENGVQVGGRIEYVRLFTIIAILILIIACINFMNLSTARASGRLKEIGVKKAIGAKRATFIFQFLSESVLMAFIALVVALVLVTLALPEFNTIIGKQLELNFSPVAIAAILGISVITGLIAGSYPAIYLSGFNTITILKGKLNRSLGELWTRKGLVVIQFTLSVVLIVSVIVVYKQIEYVQKQNLGYAQEQIIRFNIEGKIKDQLSTFVLELRKLPGVKNASSTTHSMIGHNWSTGLDWDGRDPDDIKAFQIVGVDYDFVETMGMEMKAGRSFSREFGADSARIILNETAIRTIGYQDPIGKTVENGRAEIIGVVEDFNFKSLHERVEPLFMVMMPQGVKYVMVRMEAAREETALQEIQQFYERFNPGVPFEYDFLDENFQALYESEQRVGALSRYFAGMAILISCLGLFGLAIFTADRRRKEISIRKVLGQSALQVSVMLTRDFALLVFLSIFIALPIAYILANDWLAGFAYSISLRIWYFLGAGLIALLIAMLTVGSQAIQAANRNPVEGLYEE
ncbi:ABC transporter permease [Poritiphilus flavus]|uniref:FtsX-like permease family protein n=1 Tax=Poritiphilus flavus TaxID=2697053 RepID=A0A6L9ECX7_9FLAO|nr:ABC transporter permease [Poritiphilus flavus]NAS12398.1 FtsX-like permease family protein [Poritiphilus flavus]